MNVNRRQIALSAFGAAFLAGCSSAPNLQRPAASSERLRRIAPALNSQVDIGTFPGAVSLVAHEGKLVHYEAVGFLDGAKTKPMPRDAIFRLASMTKPLTSVVTMMLTEQGVLKINDPVTNWLPELKNLKVETSSGDVPLTRPISVQDLLMHTAGFVYGPASPSPRIGKMYADLGIESLDVDITGDEMLKRLGTIPLAYQPGTTWFYSIATDVLGLLLERATKKRLDVLMQEMLIGPLGMTDTAWWVPPAKHGRLAEALDIDAQKASMLRSYRHDTDPAPRTYLKGGAGLVGTGADYLKFAQMVLNGGTDGQTRFLSRKTVEFMVSDHLVGKAGVPNATTGPGYGFGLGWGVRLYDGVGWTPGSVGDAMWAGAWGTSFWIDPREQLVGVLMAQCPSNRVHTRMLYKNLVYGAVS